MHSDPIADMFARVRNGLHARHTHVDVPMSKIKLEICRVLEAEGFIGNFEVVTETKFPVIRVTLKYDHRQRPIINKLRRVSTPGLRVYKDSKEIRPRRSGLATRIITTSSGVMTDRDARRRKIGGEVLGEVW
ncbi:MAG: 30S ribosomal protein S8 [Fimbriimonadaceae bacterium]|nr:30S ribosomal protein S8 [Fimbriimonadaceae bacterium]